MAIAITAIRSSNRLILPTTNCNINNGGERKRPSIFFSTNPSHINLDTLTHLYRSCSHSPNRFPSAAADDIDAGKIGVAVSHSAVVVAAFAEREKGLWGRILTPENGELVGFGRAVSDIGLTASIYDVMVIPSLQRLGIGWMIVQRIIRMLTKRGIYDISAVCSEKERLFFAACGFGDDVLGSTTMMYAKTTASKSDDDQMITTQAGRKLLIAPPSRLPFLF